MREKRKTKEDKEKKARIKKPEIGKESKVKEMEQSKQIKIVLIIMIGVILLIVLINSAFQASKNFEYIGLKFEKRQDGYYSRIKINFYGASPLSGKVVKSIDYDFKLKNDPRELEDIPVNAYIKFNIYQLVYVPVDPNLYECDDLYTSLIDIGRFLKALGSEATSSVSPDLNFSLENNVSYITCENTKNNTVILIQNSSQNGIEQINNCYILNVANCDIVKVKERFFIATIASHREVYA